MATNHEVGSSNLSGHEFLNYDESAVLEDEPIFYWGSFLPLVAPGWPLSQKFLQIVVNVQNNSLT